MHCLLCAQTLIVRLWTIPTLRLLRIVLKCSINVTLIQEKLLELIELITEYSNEIRQF
jgi:hypothetical protein